MKCLSAVTVAVCLSWTATAQAQTTVYTYDAHGRLTNTSTGVGATRTYRYDNANNRTRRTCCETVGPNIQAGIFDPHFYLTQYPDVRQAGVDPYTHYMSSGWTQNRWPSRFFNPVWYKSTYGVAANINPLTHYNNGGWQSGESPSPEFSGPLYLQANADVAAAGMDPYSHYLRYGYSEGRQKFLVP